MRKLHKVAAVAAMVGTFGFIGIGTASAHGGGGVGVTQGANCTSHDLNADVLGEVGVLNGLLGNALSGEGNPGGQASKLGSAASCSNSAF